MVRRVRKAVVDIAGHICVSQMTYVELGGLVQYQRFNFWLRQPKHSDELCGPTGAQRNRDHETL